MRKLPERLTPQTLDERLKGARELFEERFEHLDEKYDRWHSSTTDDIDALKDELRAVDDKVDAVEKKIDKELAAIQLAQEQGKVAMLQEADKQRISRTRWMIGTVIAVLSLGVSIIMDILK